MKLKPVSLKIGGWFSSSRALLREMETLHREKQSREAAAALDALRRP